MALTIDDLAVIMAAETIMGNTALRNPRTVPQIATSIASTFNSPTNSKLVFNTTVAGSYGARLATISLSVDAVFQSNYNWLIEVSSVTPPGAGTGFQAFDPTVNTFDEVPDGKFFLLRPGATIQIRAYNSNSSNSTAGIMSVYAVYDQLSQNEALIINRFYQLLPKLASLPSVVATVPPVQVTSIENQAAPNIKKTGDNYVE